MDQATARDIVEQAFQQVHGRAPTDSEASYTQAVAWLENQYGRVGQFAKLAANGQYNWGSLHAAGTPPNCPPGSAPGSDVGKVCFKVFSTDLAAANAFVRELTANAHWNRAKVLAAMAGSPEDVAQAMYDTKYYQGVGATPAARVQAYANLIRSALGVVGAGVPPTPSPVSGLQSPVLGILLVAALGGAAYWAYATWGPPPALARLLR